MFIPTWGRFSFWAICFRWVGSTTNPKTSFWANHFEVQISQSYSYSYRWVCCPMGPCAGSWDVSFRFFKHIASINIFLICLANLRSWRLSVCCLSDLFRFFFVFELTRNDGGCYCCSSSSSSSSCFNVSCLYRVVGVSLVSPLTRAFVEPLLQSRFRFDITRSPRGSQCTDKECPSAPPRPREARLEMGLPFFFVGV